jgi:tryptophan 2,3-dioxygenase
VEHSFLVFRQRHARMAEWVIGRRVGTGGSSGVDYLDNAALKQRIFKDLWTVRMLLIRRDQLPDPENPEMYEFQFSAS